MITPVFPFFDTLPEQQASWHTQVSQRTLQFKALSISGRISSLPAVFSCSGGIFCPQVYLVCVQWCDSDVFKRSMKYSPSIIEVLTAQ